MSGFLRKTIFNSLLLIVSIVLSFSIINLIPKRHYKYAILFEESINLTKHSQVYLGSIPSGYVDYIKNDEDNPNHSVVFIQLNQSINPLKAIARIGSRSLMSSGSIVQLTIIEEIAKLNKELKNLDDTVSGQIAWEPSINNIAYNMIGSTKTEAEKLLKTATLCCERFSSILTKIDAMVSNTQDTKIREKVDKILTTVEHIVEELKKKLPTLILVIDYLDGIRNAFK